MPPPLPASSALRLHDRFQQNPFGNAGALARHTGLLVTTINAALADLERLAVLKEVTGRRRGRIFAYRTYLDIPGEGTAPLAPAAG